jgi:nucleosome assembly protein 1-like 1
LAFEFAENEYLNTLLLEKSYTISKEYLLEKTESTDIQWKEGKNISAKKVTKKMKNKSK